MSWILFQSWYGTQFC